MEYADPVFPSEVDIVHQSTSLPSSMSGCRRPDICLLISIHVLAIVLLIQVFTTKCRTEATHDAYQFVPIRKGVLLQNIAIALRAKGDALAKVVVVVPSRFSHSAQLMSCRCQPLPDVQSFLGARVLIGTSDGQLQSVR